MYLGRDRRQDSTLKLVIFLIITYRDSHQMCVIELPNWTKEKYSFPYFTF